MSDDRNAAVIGSAGDDSALLAECAEVYRLSKRFEARSDKSVHWNVFPDDFARCFEVPEAWPSLLRNGITSGFNDDTLLAPDRWQRRRVHDYADLVPRTDTDAGYTAGAKRMFEYCVKRFGLGFVQAVQNTEVGSPRLAEFSFRVRYDRGEVEQTFRASVHDLSLVYFCGRIMQAMRSSAAAAERHRAAPGFVEIGGGFGELSAKMKLVDPALRSIIFDLPEPSAVQLYFLRSRFPDKRIYTIREFHRYGAAVFDQPFDFLLLPPALMKLLPVGWPSICVNIRSFQEMNWTSVADYFVEIQRSLPVAGMFCCINRYAKRIGDHDITYDRFPFDHRWRVLSGDKLPFQAHIKEGIFERT